MSEATRSRGRRALGVLGVMGALGVFSPSSALAQDDPEAEGTRLVELKDPLWSRERIDCQGAFCLWRSRVHHSCSAEYCYFDELYITDREDRVVSAHGRSALGQHTREVRFIAPLRVEFLDFHGPFQAGREVGADTGVDQSWVHREVWVLSADGKTFTQDPEAVRPPAWQLPSAPVPEVSKPASRRPSKPEQPRLRLPVSPAVLAKAVALCDGALHPRHHECHRGTCVLILDALAERDDSPENGFLCPVVVKGSQVRRLPLALLTADPIDFSLTPTHYVFVTWDGPYGSRGSTQAVSRTHPETMALTPTEGLHVEGAAPYPVREAASVTAARALAPTVHAYTRAHIPWGRDAWRDERDLALAWQFMRVGKNVHLHAEVDDDTVVPAAAGTGVHSDHLEVTVARGTSGSYKLGVLLAPEGQLQVRLWQRSEGERKQHLDEPFVGASGTWSPRDGGYVVDLTLPESAVRGPSSSGVSGLSVFVSDTDAKGKQETLMGHVGSLRFWSEYPPRVEEYARLEGTYD